MYTKEELKQQLRNVGLTGKETILIHSSMKAIGEVEGGADIVLDAWMEHFCGRPSAIADSYLGQCERTAPGV